MKQNPRHALVCSWCDKIITIGECSNSNGMCPTCLEEKWKIELAQLQRERNDPERLIQEDAGWFGNVVAAAMTLACVGLTKLFTQGEPAGSTVETVKR